jgi:sugar phosphate isomerase/epimerase
MIKLGLSSYSLSQAINKGEMDLPGAVRFVAENGGSHLEISPGATKLAENPDLITRILDTAKEVGIEISSYTIGANFIKPTPEEYRAEVERIKKEVEIGARLGVRRMRHDAGSRPIPETSFEQFEKDLPAIVDACGEVADVAAKYGITTSIENHGFHFQASERIQRLILAVGRDNFRTTLDVGNFLCVDEDPEAATLNNIGYASHVHFKDFHIRRNPPVKDGYIKTAHGRFLRGAITGDGDVNLDAIVKIIKNAGYKGFLSIEYEGWEECRSACTRALKNVQELLNRN